MKSTLKAMFGTLCPWGKFWLYMGLAALAAAAWMSFAVGWKMTTAHAIFLAILSFVTAFLPMAAEKIWQDGRKVLAASLAILAVPLFVIEFGQHAAYTAGIRGNDLAEAKVQNTKWTGAQDNTTKISDEIAFWKSRRASLIAQNGWTASVTAEALRARLAGLNLAIEQEAKRVKCAQKCLERTKERDEVASRIAVLEETKSLDGKIEHATAKLEALRGDAAKTEFKSSQTEHMNAFLSKAVAFVGQGQLKPSDFTEEGTQLSANLAMALAGTGLPALALFIAGLHRRKEDEAELEVVAPRIVAPVQPKATVATVASRPANEASHTVTVNVAKQDDIWKVFDALLNGQKQIAA